MEEQNLEKKINGNKNSNPKTFAEGIEILPPKDNKDSEQKEKKTQEEEKPIQEINIDKEIPKNQPIKTPEELVKELKQEKEEPKKETVPVFSDKEKINTKQTTPTPLAKEIKEEQTKKTELPKTDLEKNNIKMEEEIQGIVKTSGATAGKKPSSLMKTVRTYQGDVAGVLKNQKTSLTKMVMAEKGRKERKGVVKTQKKEDVKTKKLTIAIGVILTTTLIATGTYFVLNNINSTPKTITELKIPTIIFSNYQREVFLKNLKKKTIVNTIKTEEPNISIPLGSIMQLYLTKEDSDKEYVVEKIDGYKLLITTSVFLNSLQTKASDSLTRALETNFIFGYHSSLGNNPFLLFKVKSYENVYAGMLDWEKYIYNDLINIFKKENSILEEGVGDFKDIVVANKDVRALLNKEGKIDFAYSFPDKNTLIIVNNKTTMEEIFRRVLTASLERQN